MLLFGHQGGDELGATEVLRDELVPIQDGAVHRQLVHLVLLLQMSIWQIRLRLPLVDELNTLK